MQCAFQVCDTRPGPDTPFVNSRFLEDKRHDIKRHDVTDVPTRDVYNNLEN